jgi:hypothetical protein
MSQIKLLCIDDTNKPEDIPFTHWVEEDKLYTLKDVARLTMQGNTLGVQIEEINLISLCLQYEYFSLTRFAIKQEDLEGFKDIIEASGQKDSITTEDLNKLFNI